MNSDLLKRVEALENRVKVLEEERSILATLYTYSHAIDYGLKAKWLDCFVEDAIYKVEVSGATPPSILGIPQPPEGLKGRDLLSAYIGKHTHAPELWHKHCLVEPIIKLEKDDNASVESYFARLDEDQNGAYILAFGRYRDKMVKGKDGRWRFQERICQIESRLTKR